MAIMTDKSPINTHFFRLKDGRKVAYRWGGSEGGKPVFFFHGSPGSRLESSAADAAAISRNWQIIAPDRPGMGKSDFKPGYTLLEYTEDIRELADGLGFETFGTMGHSGGGATVLSCARAMPERLDFALDLGGWAPTSVPELQSAMTSIDRFFAGRDAHQPNAKVPLFFQLPFALLGLAAKIMPPSLFVKMLALSRYFSPADLAFLSAPEKAKFLVESVRESFSQGDRGPVYDALLRYRDWGFQLSDIDFPVCIFHGKEDLSAPYSFAEYKHRHLPNSQLYTYEREGHFFLWQHWDDIFRLAVKGNGE